MSSILDGTLPAAYYGPATPAAGAHARGTGRLAPEWMAFGVGAAWVTACLALTWPALSRQSIQSASVLDSSVFALAGDLLRRGGRPYLSYWDHKPPLIHLLNAAALTLSGGRVWGLWLFSLAAALLALWLCVVATRRLLGPAAAVVAVTYLAFSLPGLFVADLGEGYAMPLQWAAVALLAAWATGGDRALPPARFGAGLGVVTCAAALLKPTLIGAGVSVALTASVVLVARRDWGALGRFVLGGIASTLAVGAVVIGYLRAEGALAAFTDQVLHYNAIYSSYASFKQRAGAVAFGLPTAARYGSLVLPAAGWLLAIERLIQGRRRLGEHAPLVLAVVWLPLDLALTSTSGRKFPIYFAALFASLAYLSGVLALAAARHFAARSAQPERRQSLPSAGALAVAVAVSGAGLTVSDARDRAPLLATRAALVGSTVAYVRAHTGARDAILVWGHAADIYLLSDRRPASRFIYPLPLLTPGYADSALVREFMNEVRAAAPAVIVGVSGRGLEGEELTPPLDRWDPLWQVPTKGAPDYWKQAAPWWTMTPAVKEFYDYVAQHYVLVGRVGGRWPVYERIDREDRTTASTSAPRPR